MVRKSQPAGREIPNLAGYVAIVTGGNSGIGYETVLQLALHGARVYIAARSPQKITDAITQMKASTKAPLDLKPLDLDLQSFQSVDSAAKAFMKQEQRLDILINNAGIMASPFALTPDGFEAQWQTNHLAPFLLTRTLLPVLESTAANSISKSRVRVVNVSSEAAFSTAPATGLNLQDPNFADDKGAMAPWRRYGHSKLASILHARALHNRFHAAGISAYSLHPGIIHTNLQSKDPTWVGTLIRCGVILRILPGVTNVAGGARTTLFCATSEQAREGSGGFFSPPGKADGKAEKWVGDRELVDRVWGGSERMVREAGFAG